MAEDIEENNVYDFAAYRMQRDAEAYSLAGDHDAAEALWEAIEAYLQGLCTVTFIEGRTYLTPANFDLVEATEK